MAFPISQESVPGYKAGQYFVRGSLGVSFSASFITNGLLSRHKASDWLCLLKFYDKLMRKSAAQMPYLKDDYIKLNDFNLKD